MIEILNILGVDQPEHISRALAGLFSFFGILLTGILGVLAWLGKQALLRRERRQDTRKAIYAEIKADWRNLMAFRGFDQMESELLKQFAKQRDYTPFFSHMPRPTVYLEVAKDIHVLGNAEIPAVVEYYRHTQMMDRFSDDLRAESYKNFEPERKKRMTLDRIQMMRRSQILGEKAMSELEIGAKVRKNERFSELKREWQRHDQR